MIDPPTHDTLEAFELDDGTAPAPDDVADRERPLQVGGLTQEQLRYIENLSRTNRFGEGRP